MLEAALVVPVIGTVLLGTVMLQRFYMDGQQATIMARRCAWQHAMAGCPDKLPDGCDSRALSNESDSAGANDSADLRSRAQTERGSGAGVLSQVPLLSNSIDTLFGSTSHAHAEREVPAVGGHKLYARGDIAVLCNTRPVDVGTAIETMFCNAVHFGRCGGSR